MKNKRGVPATAPSDSRRDEIIEDYGDLICARLPSSVDLPSLVSALSTVQSSDPFAPNTASYSYDVPHCCAAAGHQRRWWRE